MNTFLNLNPNPEQMVALKDFVERPYIIAHAHLPSFLRYDIFRFSKLKVVSNRLPLFSFLFPFGGKFTQTG